MRRAGLLLALAVTIPTVLLAQEEEDTPPATILTISYYQCPQSAIQDIAEDYDRYSRPFEEELVEEGLLAGAGLFFHQWADEWNVNYYRTGWDLADMLDAVAEVGERAIAMYPELADEPGPFAVCTAHKDGIYGFGPGTDRPLPEDGGDGN